MTMIEAGTNKRKLETRARELSLKSWAIVRAREPDGKPITVGNGARLFHLYHLVGMR